MDDTSVATAPTKSNFPLTEPPPHFPGPRHAIQTTDISRLATLDVVTPDSKRRKRLTISTALMGVILSVAAFHVSVLTRAQYFEDAVRIQGWGAIFFSIAAALAAIAVVPLVVYHIRDLAQRPGKPFVWVAIGAIFGLATPLFTGGLSRTALAFSGLAEGHYGIGSMFSLMIDAVLVFPYDFIVEGATMVILWLEFGVPFAIIGYLIDRANCSKNELVAQVGPWAISVIAATPILLFALFGPIDFLRDLA